jgi:biotin-(acetyl-CoA carboxylase) ligase
LEELPEQIRTEATTIRHELGSEVSLQLLLSNILVELRNLYESFKAGWRLEILRDVKEAMELMGEPVSISLSQGTQLIAVLEDLDELGRIAVRLEQDRIFLSPGDIERITPL